MFSEVDEVLYDGFQSMQRVRRSREGTEWAPYYLAQYGLSLWDKLRPVRKAEPFLEKRLSFEPIYRSSAAV
jgi:hypothetical protein